LHNLYGPTEAAVDVTSWQCRPDDPRRLVPIGSPVANTALHVLDRHGHQAPLGVPGELHIAGVQLARGYLNRPELTAQSFVCHPARARFYRPGDRAPPPPGGARESPGRLDPQAKPRGSRVELGEVEPALAEPPPARESVALAPPGPAGDTRLVAYVVPDLQT